MVMYSSLAVPLGLPFFNSGFRELGSIGWVILIGIMIIRPLSDVFSDIKFLRKLVPMRKEFGILSATLILAHGYGYFLSNKLSVLSEITNSSYWAYNGIFLWGAFGFIIAFFLLLSSNMTAVRILKKWWKPLQRFSYLFFLLGGIHIALVNSRYLTEIVYEMVIVLSLWLLAHFGIKINIFKKKDLTQ